MLFVLLILISGQLLAEENRFELTTAISGIVQAINIKPGDKVKKGQVLLVLDQRVFNAKYEEAMKKSQSAAFDLKEANKRYKQRL